jgi:nucleoside-diphosphate-sugar epimerase
MLVEKGWRVRALTRKGFDSEDPAIEVIRGDIRDERVLEKFIEGASALFHCAAEFAQTDQIWDINVKATETILEITKRASVDYFCYLSSAGVLGACNDAWVDENTSCHPRDTYEKSKYAAEQLVMSSGLDAKVCVLRPVFVVSSQRPGFVEYPMRGNLMDRLKVLLKGKEHGHIVHAKDIAAAAVFFLDHPLQKPECFYVSCDEDELNTVAGIAGYYRYLHDGERGVVKLPFSLPCLVPYLIRSVLRGPSLHGRTRFSSAKIKEHGFKFPLGFRGAIREIIKHQHR